MVENRVGDRRGGLRKSTLFVIGVVVGVVIWRWHYVVNVPIWLYRAALADHTSLYAGSTNGLRNRDLVMTARGYVRQFTQVDVGGKRMSSEEFHTTGVSLDPAWFDRHHPETVDYNPFAPAADGNFAVTWMFAPGCQRAVTQVLSKPGPGWYDLKGRPCYDGYAVSVFMSPDLKPTAIRVTPVAGLR